MNTVFAERSHTDVYENFDPKRDALFFKIGSHGVISFHGRNCNIRKRLTEEQRKSLSSDPAFVRVSAGCYVNTAKVTDIEQDFVYFGDRTAGAKRLAVSRRHQQLIRQMLQSSGSAALSADK